MSEKELKIRDFCGDYALDIPFADGSVNTIYFNSKQNAEIVKHIIEVDGSNTVCEMSEESFYKDVKNGVEQAMKECELTIGMTLKEAVEKQIPKKPLNICTPVVTWGICPFCRGELNKIEKQTNRVFKTNAYCMDCGQALDWSDIEREKLQ